MRLRKIINPWNVYRNINVEYLEIIPKKYEVCFPLEKRPVGIPLGKYRW